MYSGNEWAGGVTSKFARRLRNSRASRSPTSSETLSAAVATAMPNASAAPVRSLCRGRRLKESATSRINMGLSVLQERVVQPIIAVRGSPKYFPQLVQPQTRVSELLRHLFFRLRQRAHIHYQIAALNARGHTDSIAPANFANRRDIYRGPTVSAKHI